MQRRANFDSIQIMYRSQELLKAASNRYKITVQVANRAKRRRYEGYFEDDYYMKPPILAIIEMSDELTQPEIIAE